MTEQTAQPSHSRGVQYEVTVERHDRAAFERAWNRGARTIMYGGHLRLHEEGAIRGELIHGTHEWPTVAGLYDFRDAAEGELDCPFEWSVDAGGYVEPLGGGREVQLPYEEWRH